ncbi:MAG: hypothetical protein NTX45_05620 [Proteobacteria bacterium]|nr:hypothetical protein [Pseudomonadota bacterium]
MDCLLSGSENKVEVEGGRRFFKGLRETISVVTTELVCNFCLNAEIHWLEIGGCLPLESLVLYSGQIQALA